LITYVDASVVLRSVLGEADPLAGWDTLRPASSEIITVESLRAIERLRWTTSVDAASLAERRATLLTVLKGFELVTISSPVLERAGDPFPTYVATLDAIHLATAIIMREDGADVAFATHDVKLGVAARAMGFDVIGV
jgi:uncharacterized protein